MTRIGRRGAALIAALAFGLAGCAGEPSPSPDTPSSGRTDAFSLKIGDCTGPLTSGTVDELLMAAEYIMSEGNDNVILCERGIRTFETRTRNTFDLNAVPVLHHLSHLPVVADPSHATGYTRYVEPMALAATACGANGLEIEVHDEPSRAWSDGAQALTPDQFDDTMRRIRAIREVVCQETME